MSPALITTRVHKPPIPRFHRKWLDYDRVRDAALHRAKARTDTPKEEEAGNG